MLKLPLAPVLTLLGSLFAASCGANGSRSADMLPSSPQAAIGAQTLDATSIWRVTATPHLNCREAPGVAGAVVYELLPGSVVDVVDGTRAQADGYTWIHVNPRGDIDHNNCFLAADDRFLVSADDLAEGALSTTDLYEATVLEVLTPLNCRDQPGRNAPIVFDGMPAGTLLDVVTDAGELGHVRWQDDLFWIQVNPRGDIDHNRCWVATLSSYVRIIERN